MKLKILPEVHVGAHIIRIRHSEAAMTIADLRAQLSSPHGIIRLSYNFEGAPRTNAQLFESLLHETIHAVDHLYMRELEERQVGALASGLAQALMSLGIEPDFSEIPEEEL